MQIGTRNHTKMKKWDLIMEMSKIYANQNTQRTIQQSEVMAFRYAVTLLKSQTLLDDAEGHDLTILLATLALGSLLICLNLAPFQNRG